MFPTLSLARASPRDVGRPLPTLPLHFETDSLAESGAVAQRVRGDSPIILLGAVLSCYLQAIRDAISWMDSAYCIFILASARRLSP